ncbi:uncharacterized protein LOC115957146 [Quercus lobata]|uniref:uncharacterized protein LOC115957146 n=1 Tax=Quercus lobata TaxID=97700 RepID=UPI0012460AB4|nr:uncharacterized protein LOC115957146 [Quercus lobata]
MNIEERRVVAEPTEVLEDIPLEEDNLKKFTRIGTSMEEKTKQDLVQFLRKSIDIFAWSHEDMPIIDPSIITHRLNVYPFSKPVRHKKKVFAPERDNAIKEEVQKLITTKFIQEIYYPNCYPLPRIDQLVDSITGHQLLSFMDAFSSYNQIKMDKADQENTSFITSQGQNVEVYMDDMLTKSLDEKKHLDNLQETFDTLRQYNMKLNPSKCAFGVSSHKGIKANPNKIQAILNMEPPKNVKEVQSLTRRVAALNKFVSKVTDKCLPFFKVLRNAFEWKNECQKAFQDFKVYLTMAPLLSPSIPVEYEALLKGLELAKFLGAESAVIQGDSQLIIGQVNGTCEVKEERMKKYLNRVKRLIKRSKEANFFQIPREENMEADALANVASTDGLVDELDEVQYMSTIDLPEVQQIEGEGNWMTPIIAYLRDGRLPEEKDEVRKLRIISTKYVLIDEVLYKRDFS